jgi:hypothetical protein
MKAQRRLKKEIDQILYFMFRVRPYELFYLAKWPEHFSKVSG